MSLLVTRRPGSLCFRIDYGDLAGAVGVRLLFRLSAGSPVCLCLAIHLVSIRWEGLIVALLWLVVLSINPTVRLLLQGF